MFCKQVVTDRFSEVCPRIDSRRAGLELGSYVNATSSYVARVELGLLLGLLGYGKAPKTAFRLPGLIRKRPLNYGV